MNYKNKKVQILVNIFEDILKKYDCINYRVDVSPDGAGLWHIKAEVGCTIEESTWSCEVKALTSNGRVISVRTKTDITQPTEAYWQGASPALSQIVASLNEVSQLNWFLINQIESK